MLKTLIHIFRSMIHIHQKKKNIYVPIEILLQDQEPRIIENKRRRGHKLLLRGITGTIVYGMVFLNADDTFDLDGCVDLVHLIQKVRRHYKSRPIIQ